MTAKEIVKLTPLEIKALALGSIFCRRSLNPQASLESFAEAVQDELIKKNTTPK